MVSEGSPRGVVRRATSAGCRRELQRVLQAPGELAFELRPVAEDTQVASARDSAVIRIQQAFSEAQRITYTQAKHQVQLPGESEVHKGRMRDPARHSALLTGDVRNREVREGIIEPFLG